MPIDNKDVSNLLAPRLAVDEGWKPRRYKDSLGLWTIGCGRCLDRSPLDGFERAFLQASRQHGDEVRADGVGLRLRDAEIRWLLDRDLARTYKALDKHLPWWRELDLPRAYVVANMGFNMGCDSETHGLLTFKSTLAHMQAHRYAQASIGMLASKWAGQVGERAQRLALIMATGKLSNV